MHFLFYGVTPYGLFRSQPVRKRSPSLWSIDHHLASNDGKRLPSTICICELHSSFRAFYLLCPQQLRGLSTLLDAAQRPAQRYLQPTRPASGFTLLHRASAESSIVTTYHLSTTHYRWPLFCIRVSTRIGHCA